ncbi:radical SAM protein [Candidatus Woesearchaeota archaeon]|nr:radical SAM protein [Candidatus Woesearchaeota archaeon]
MLRKLRYQFGKFRNSVFYEDFNSAIKKLDKVYPPKYVIWDATRRCNLRCEHCGATKEEYSEELTTEQVKDVIDQLAAIKTPFFAVTGGEPLLRGDLIGILGYAREKGIKTGIATNGYLLTEGNVRKLKEARVSSFQVSLDGLERTHNKIRGNPQSFQRAVRGIKRLQAAGFPIVSVATTVTTTNIGELDGLRQLLRDLGVKTWRICITMPIGRAEDNKLLLKEEKLRWLLEWTARHRKQRPRILIGENLPFLGPYERLVRNEPLPCPVGFTACCIGTDGHVRGCPEMPDKERFREGSVLEQPFLQLWKNGFKKYRARAAIKDDERCRRCANRLDCFGGCWVMREGNTQCIYELLGTQRPSK